MRLLLILIWQEDWRQAQSGWKRLVEQLRSVIQADEYRISSWGIAVADARTGEMIDKLNPHQLFLPHSLTKIFHGLSMMWSVMISILLR